MAHGRPSLRETKTHSVWEQSIPHRPPLLGGQPRGKALTGEHGVLKAQQGNPAAFLAQLQQLGERVRGKTVTLWVDNASWHKGPRVREFLAPHQRWFHLHYHPPYHPELNPQERIWRRIRALRRHSPGVWRTSAEAILRTFSGGRFAGVCVEEILETIRPALVYCSCQQPPDGGCQPLVR